MELEILHIKPESCNENNQHHYTPIIPSVVIQFHIDWYNSLPIWIQLDLNKVFSEFKLTSFELPHIEIIKNEIFWKFYNWYYGIYDMYNYKDLVQPAYFIGLTQYQREELKELCKLTLLTNRELNLEEDCMQLASLFHDMQTVLDIHSDIGLFVKTSHKSAKHDFKLFSAKTLEEIFENIINSIEIYKDMHMVNHIILKPWNDKITKDTEFRVFVENKKIIGISQQACGIQLKNCVN